MSEEQNHKKRRIKKRTIYAIILLVMLICFVMIGLLLLFQVRKIEVEGNQILSKQEIADWLQQDEFSTNSVYLLCKYPALNPGLFLLPLKIQNRKWLTKILILFCQINRFTIG